ncbi:MAG TPA: regulatory iron-sulfur-containing complex subunit RicT [Thermoanaerobaculaceae bacterium]|nr:regulatory iron-sulfur-containing complex subunit RicT [Thermoanaerobaculaceae bacterium]HRS17300.1 regulatory iron-sulfur-containing complex subunit RicT [Thermoanaerobaculaceae bacterium]
MSAAVENGHAPRRRLVRVVFSPHLPGQVCAVADGLDLSAGQWCVVSCPEGERVGTVSRFELPVMSPSPPRVAGTVVRTASEADLHRHRELGEVELDALRFFRQRAREMDLPVRPVSAVVPLDRDTVVISFAAEERVDARELHRELGRRLRRRVELRQIGVRDQARAAGGWGPCGRTLCCSSFMTRFASVTIRMAKAQKLSLNPTRISGMCGRLMCCLAHEASAEGRSASAPARGQTVSGAAT